MEINGVKMILDHDTGTARLMRKNEVVKKDDMLIDEYTDRSLSTKL